MDDVGSPEVCPTQDTLYEYIKCYQWYYQVHSSFSGGHLCIYFWSNSFSHNNIMPETVLEWNCAWQVERERRRPLSVARTGDCTMVTGQRCPTTLTQTLCKTSTSGLSIMPPWTCRPYSMTRDWRAERQTSSPKPGVRALRRETSSPHLTSRRLSRSILKSTCGE